MSFKDKIVQGLMDVANLATNPPFDPKYFEDEIADQTEWSPMGTGGASYATHKAIQISENHLVFKVAMASYLIPVVFILAGIIACLVVGYVLMGKIGPVGFIISIPFGISFIGIGIFVLFRMNPPLAFDKSAGLFWKGKKMPSGVDGNGSSVCQISDIYAIQLIRPPLRVHASSNTSSNARFEMNIVLKNAERIHMVVYGKLEALRKDAAVLSKFLGVLLWDNTVIFRK